MNNRIYSLLLLLCFFVMSCSSTNHIKVYKIGVDPTWFPLDLANKEPYIFAFTNDLMQKISSEERCDFQRVSVSWDNLLLGLEKGEYEGICCSIEPFVFNLEKYRFSDVFLPTGPVLVAKVGAFHGEAISWHEKIIAALNMSDEQLIAQKYPDASIQVYDSIAKALQALEQGSVDAAAVGYLEAFSYVTDIYQGQLEVISEPLNQQGLKVVTLIKTSPKLIQTFNEGLEELKASGGYDSLLSKWKLGN